MTLFHAGSIRGWSWKKSILDRLMGDIYNLESKGG
jgi:hypothetical protein